MGRFRSGRRTAGRSRSSQSGQLKRLNLDAGSALTLCEAPGGRGGSWSPQDVILFSPGVRGGLQQVPAEGGAPSPVTSTEGTTFTSHRWPQFLPDGRHFVYLAVQQEEGRDQSAVFLGTLGGRAPQMLLRSRSQAVFANGQLLFLRDRTLWAQPFDPESAQLNGAPVAIVRDVLEDPTIWCAVFSVNDSGTLVYQTGQAGTALTLYDRDGHELGPVGEHGIMFDVNLSPDGKRVAVNRGEPADIWVYELGRGTSLRLTFDPRNETLPVWSPDGHTLAYARIEPDGRAAVVQVPSTGGEPTVMIPPGDRHRDRLVARRQVPAAATGLARHGSRGHVRRPGGRADSRAAPARDQLRRVSRAFLARWPVGELCVERIRA